MVLFLLKDGTRVEVREGTDVIHKNGTLFCLSSSGRSLLALNDREVDAYTFNWRTARELAEPVDALSELDLQKPLRPGQGRKSRRNGRPES